jgi:hypothetical protein
MPSHNLWALGKDAGDSCRTKFEVFRYPNNVKYLRFDEYFSVRLAADMEIASASCSSPASLNLPAPEMVNYLIGLQLSNLVDAEQVKTFSIEHKIPQLRQRIGDQSYYAHLVRVERDGADLKTFAESITLAKNLAASGSLSIGNIITRSTDSLKGNWDCAIYSFVWQDDLTKKHAYFIAEYYAEQYGVLVIFESTQRFSEVQKRAFAKFVSSIVFVA